MNVSLFKIIQGFPHKNGVWTLQSGGPITINYCKGYNCAPTTEGTFANLAEISDEHYLTIDTDTLNTGTYTFRYTTTNNGCTHFSNITLTVC